MELSRVTLAVLAGGMGVRMGGAKSGLRIGGVAILRYLFQRVDWAGPTLLVSGVGNEGPAGCELFDGEVTDAVTGEGPLRGVLTALEGAGTDVVAVVSVDMPGVGRAQV
jgi:molybdopterin-guanine dinucleotide biosynthesis protein A